MARCKLDLDDPRVVRLIGGDNASPDLKEGLAELQSKLAKEHAQSDFVTQKMPRFPQYQNRIWKWTFAPSGVHSSTKKKWRMLAYLPGPEAEEPILALPFHIYSKADTEVLGPKEIAAILKKFLATVQEKISTAAFKRTTDQNGQIISHCEDCWEMVAMSVDEGEVELLEGTHEQDCHGPQF